METRNVTLCRRGAAREFTLRALQPSDLAEILAVQAEIVGAVARPPVFEPSDAGDFLESMRLDVLRGLYDGDRLAALNLLVRNRDTPRNLCRLCGDVPFDRCYTFDTVQVRREYHGYGIQRFFLDEAARVAGAGCCIVATVSPENPPSLRAFLSRGYTPLRRLPLYGGERFLMRKWLT